MKTRIFTLFYCLVFTISTATLWIACSNEDNPAADYKIPIVPPLIGSNWICTSMWANFPVISAQSIPAGSSVYLHKGSVISDIYLFPSGTTYYMENEELYIEIPSGTVYLVGVEYTSMKEMTWSIALSSTQHIKIYFHVEEGEQSGIGGESGSSEFKPVSN